MINDLDIKIDDLGDLFEINSTPSSSLKTRYKKPKFQKSKNVKYRYAVQAVKELSVSILNKEEILMLVDGSFIFGDFIEAFMVENNLLCKNLTISTLGISKDNVDSLANLIKGNYLESLTLHVSDYFYAHNRANVKYIYEKLDINNSFQLIVSSNHTKVILLELENQKICMHGSANLRSSDCIEQISITHNLEVYSFFQEVFTQIEQKYYIINKSVRNKELSRIFKE